ncbi:MAG: sigma-54-dependent Fis family transcriptional regulator [candidate division WOR-3 bacterium]|nr:MAG: sigma-54-dependent Fis family transcriptional regulator [candidate division WOR-3 bacterium]
MPRSRILVVDDEEIMRSSLSDWLIEDGYDVLAVEDGFHALERVKQEEWDLAVVDLKMPKMDGLEVLKKMNKIKPKLPVIIITAYATIDSAVMAIKEGAADYIVKPFNPEEISIVIAKLVERQRLIKENIRLRRALAKRFKFQDLVGKSPEMLKVIEMIKTVAPTKSTVLIRGESGTGKELVARAIHELGPRKNFPFIAAACGAIPETLLEAELFGYEKGAFTGAVSQHKGRIEMADRGTLFLDEIGDISPKTQVDLLRFIQEREFQRIGGKTAIKVDVRIIAATHKNIEEMIAKGEFRDDLYYRLNVITIEIPSLRERKEDIPIFAEHFLEKFSLDTGKTVDNISDEVMKILIGYNWPGNVRQLENAIEHALVVSQEPEIKVQDLPQYLITQEDIRDEIKPTQSMSDMERRHIAHVLKAHGWNITKTAQVLGINRITLYKKIKKYNLKKDKDTGTRP